MNRAYLNAIPAGLFAIGLVSLSASAQQKTLKDQLVGDWVQVSTSIFPRRVHATYRGGFRRWHC